MEDINRHHLHIVSVNVDEHGRRLNKDFIHRRSKRITTELEKKYGLYPADRRQHRHDNPLRKVDVSQGDVKRQVANNRQGGPWAAYKFRTDGRIPRPAFPLQCHGGGSPRHGGRNGNITGWSIPPPTMPGNKVSNPFKASRIGKSVGYEAVRRRFEYSKAHIRDKRPADMTRKTVAAALARTYHKEGVHRPASYKGCGRGVPPYRTRGASTGQPSSTTERAVC